MERQSNMATTSRRPDILIQTAEGETVAIVEVKNIANLTREEAIQLRRNLARYGVPFQAPFFLLLSQDVGFMWKDSKVENLDSAPDYEFPMAGVVARYSHRRPGERLYEEEFELLVFQWLNSLAVRPRENVEEPEKTLMLARFIEAVRNASILLEAEV